MMFFMTENRYSEAVTRAIRWQCYDNRIKVVEKKIPKCLAQVQVKTFPWESMLRISGRGVDPGYLWCPTAQKDLEGT